MQGVARYKIKLLPHCDEWHDEFLTVKQRLKEIFGDHVVDIQHIGSTAIMGVYAKPILDVAVVLNSFENMNIDGMKAAGYDYCGPQNEQKDRYLFVLRGEDQISLHHVHCYEIGNKDFFYVTKFRDYLNTYKDYSKQYSDLKVALAKQYPDDRFAYTDKKESFIRMIYELIDKENSACIDRLEMEKNMEPDCGFTRENKWFRYRAAAIIVEDGCVLMAGNERDDYYYSIIQLAEESI